MTGRDHLYLLAVDHRRSFERLFGIDQPVSGPDRSRLEGAKALVAEALGDVAARCGGTTGGGLGILIDDLYGGAAIATARHAHVAVALAFERSGQALLDFEHADWRDRLAADPPDYVKVLIRHRADGEAAALAVQLERLSQLSEACAASPAAFLVELLTPYSEAELADNSAERLELDLRPRLVVDAIAQIQEAGVAADVWKVEGVADPAGCASIVAAARRDGRDAGRRGARCRSRCGDRRSVAGGGRWSRVLRLCRRPQHLGRCRARPRSRRPRRVDRARRHRSSLWRVHRHLPAGRLTRRPGSPFGRRPQWERFGYRTQGG